MTVAYELDFETYRPRLYVLPDQSARLAPSPRVRRRRVVVVAAVVTLLVLLALPIRAFGGSTLAQGAPTQGAEDIVKAGSTQSSNPFRAFPPRASSLTGQLTLETGTGLVVPGEHIFIP